MTNLALKRRLLVWSEREFRDFSTLSSETEKFRKNENVPKNENEKQMFRQKSNQVFAA
jgi:hypothetical protein